MEAAPDGVLTARRDATDQGTEAVATYHISGDDSHKLDEFAPVVDPVIDLQFGAFAAFADKAP
jgi:hypothetical protein